MSAKPTYGVWQPIDTAPRDGTPILARFTDEVLSREGYSHAAPYAVVRVQRDSVSGDPKWTMLSLAGPFGVGFSMAQFASWTPLPEPPA